jgi:hypothetical protein
MRLEQKRLGTRYPSDMQALQIAHLFLGPGLDHLAGVRLTIAVAEAILAGYVLVAILENQNRCLEYLNGIFLSIATSGIVYIGLFSCA